jgi:hypothetical protein
VRHVEVVANGGSGPKATLSFHRGLLLTISTFTHPFVGVFVSSLIPTWPCLILLNEAHQVD